MRKGVKGKQIRVNIQKIQWKKSISILYTPSTFQKGLMKKDINQNEVSLFMNY